MEINITERVAAEGSRDPHKLTIRGKTFTAAPSVPWKLVKSGMSGDKTFDFEALGAAVFDDWEALEDWVTVDEMKAVLGTVAELYADMGESSASAQPSKSTGKRSRPTSSGTTKSTSAKRSTAKKPSRSAASRR